MLTFGNYTVEFFNHGFLRLDGGSMFGSVPKPLWERKIPSDEKNRIRLATRSLLIKNSEKTILVDVGCGDKWSEKEHSIYQFEGATEEQPALDREVVTDLIITHLHFDHAGGLTYKDESGELALTYPNATIWIQKENYELGLSPNLRERASYLKDHIAPLPEEKLQLVDGSKELFPDLKVHISNGHTTGLQYIELRDGSEVLYYPSDLIPTSHHLPLPYHMGFDMCAQQILSEKEKFLKQALEENALLVFEHDPEVASARIEINSKGHYSAKLDE